MMTSQTLTLKEKNDVENKVSKKTLKLLLSFLSITFSWSPKRNHVYDPTRGFHAELDRCIYGIKRSKRKWYFQLSNFLKSMRFEIFAKEPYLLVKAVLLLFIHFHDILVMSKQSCFRRDFAICWSLDSMSSREHMGVRVKFAKMGFHSLNTSILKKFRLLPLLTM